MGIFFFKSPRDSHALLSLGPTGAENKGDTSDIPVCRQEAG